MVKKKKLSYRVVILVGIAAVLTAIVATLSIFLIHMREVRTYTWKTYTNPTNHFSFQYPARGAIRTDGCFTAGGTCQFYIGECGKATLQEDKDDQVLVDNFFLIATKRNVRTIGEFLKEQSFDAKNAKHLSTTSSHADEAVMLENNWQDDAPLDHVMYIFRKGDLLVMFIGLQNDGNPGGCVEGMPDPSLFAQGTYDSQIINQHINWVVADSFKFF